MLVLRWRFLHVSDMHVSVALDHFRASITLLIDTVPCCIHTRTVVLIFIHNAQPQLLYKGCLLGFSIPFLSSQGSQRKNVGCRSFSNKRLLKRANFILRNVIFRSLSVLSNARQSRNRLTVARCLETVFVETNTFFIVQ